MFENIFRNLMAQKGAFSEFLIQYLQEQGEEELAELQDTIEDEDLKFILQRQVSVISSQTPDRTWVSTAILSTQPSNRIVFLDHGKDL